MPPDAVYADFAAGLLDPGRPVPVPGASAGRYAVYRNNVTVSLIEALAATYPAVRRLTGPDFFRAMARFHIRETPPCSPLLFEYGRDFPAFIDRYDHARDLPWLSDVARIERAWLDAYHAADAEPLGAAMLAAVPPEALPGLRFVAHPAARILRSGHPAASIFAMNRGDGPVGPLGTSAPEDCLITRPAMAVTVRHLAPGHADLLGRLIAGEPLGTAVEAVPGIDLPACIAGMIEAGVFTAIRFGDRPHDPG